MRIKEACARCGLTKKAMEYYEAKGLIEPALLENGYREYGEREIAALKEIAVLRRCGLDISAIKDILHSKNKAAALEKYAYVADLRLQKLGAMREGLKNLARSYDIDEAFAALHAQGEDLLTVKERLALAFPGSYGLFLSLHFGRFLHETIDTPEKKAAYRAILQYLDDAALHLSPELLEFLESSPLWAGDTAELQAQISESMARALSDTEGYIEENREQIEEYLAFKASDEFTHSPAAQLQRKLLEFQKESGYEEVFLANMKRLSPSYAAYARQLETANQKFADSFGG